jgi:hypothetical protein
MNGYDDHDLAWLVAARPETPPPAPGGTGRARRALVAHATPRKRRRRERPLALAAAVAAAVAALPLGGGDGAPLTAKPAAAMPLIKLSARLQAAPAPPGDATLVHRVHRFPDSPTFTGNDLYMDDGRYFYGMTFGALQDAFRQTATVDDDQTSRRERQAARDALTLPPAQARRRMIAATGAPVSADAAPPASAEAKRRPAAKKMPGPTPTPASRQSLENNRVWMGSMDTLIAGVGRTDVRAGVMKLLATVPTVSAEDTGDAIRVRDTNFPNGYTETMYLDPRTGVLQRMVGGVPGQPPSVVVTYTIRRVTAVDALR